jgi:hypothetical protein
MTTDKFTLAADELQRQYDETTRAEKIQVLSDRLQAGRALLASLIAMCEPYGNMPAEYFTSPRPREVIIAARAAITLAKAAGITPTP